MYGYLTLYKAHPKCYENSDANLPLSFALLRMPTVDRWPILSSVGSRHTDAFMQTAQQFSFVTIENIGHSLLRTSHTSEQNLSQNKTSVKRVMRPAFEHSHENVPPTGHPRFLKSGASESKT